jgi:hypothetical protein
MDLKVTCIRKSNSQLAHERIVYIGGVDADGVRWRYTVAEAIEGISVGKLRFYTHVGGHPFWIVVAVSALGHKYLKTDHDGEQPINLLSLRECPPD